MKNTAVIILAAGKGTRMGGKIPKVLRILKGKPLICWTLELIKGLSIKTTVLVVGYKGEEIIKKVNSFGFYPTIATQEKQLGTADSLKAGLQKVPKDIGTVLVLFGDDSALYKKKIILNFLHAHIKDTNRTTWLVAQLNKPTGIGGLKLDSRNNIIGIMTKDDMEKNNITLHKVLCGAFYFDRKWLEEMLPLVKINPSSGEYPLPGLIKVAKKKREYIGSYLLRDMNQWNSVNTQEELKRASMKKSKNGKKS